MTTAGAPSRRGVMERVRVAVLPLVLAALAVLSLSYPLAAPTIAVGGGVTAFLTARKTRSRVAWFALAVCAVVLALSMVIDLGLLPATAVQFSHTTGGNSA